MRRPVTHLQDDSVVSYERRTINPYSMPAVRRIVRASKTLSVGAKLVFEALVDRARHDGRCFPSIGTIAEDIGVQVRRARRFVRELERARYCERECAFDSNGRQTSNRFVFPWRAEYEAEGRGSKLSVSPTRSKLSASPDGPILSGRSGSELSATGRLGLSALERKQIEGNQNESSSSSSGDDRSVVDLADATPPTPTTIERVGSEPWPWTCEETQEVREAIGAHYAKVRHRGQLALMANVVLPDLPLTRKVLAHMQGPPEVRVWLWDLSKREVDIRRWGFYPHDARGEWRDRRADVLNQWDAQRAADLLAAQIDAERKAAAAAECEAAELADQRERERQQEFIDAAVARGWKRFHPNSHCARCFGFGLCNRDGTDICECASGHAVRHKLERCNHCENSGVVNLPDGLCAWCKCAHAARRRRSQPNTVDGFNRAIANNRAMSQHGATVQ